jgi:hypothetical protein
MLAPGLATIACTAGTATGTALVLVRPGNRLVQTDAQWRLDQGSATASTGTGGSAALAVPGSEFSLQAADAVATTLGSDRAPRVGPGVTAESSPGLSVLGRDFGLLLAVAAIPTDVERAQQLCRDALSHRTPGRTDGRLGSMQPIANAESDRAIKVTPEIRHTAPWRIASATVLAPARLRIAFIDGTVGEVDMSAFLRNPRVEGTVFEPLRDPAVFSQARVISGAVEWPNGADLAPDAMYDAILENGIWTLD